MYKASVRGACLPAFGLPIGEVEAAQETAHDA